ncbi:V-set and immunoglobulin domain-containing protein 10-like [Alosa sapidissima]|uniref:V-set and immunoglobulin domain-containing protein 10-like n=1 Tax=Alosa sapidissima TaxID=34773 RepID=UPI001C098C71|nr:V-set and immunoglobulin domain-containing protein 10-like [Alosa sapidissima]
MFILNSVDFHHTYFGLLLIFLIRGCESSVKPIGPSLFKALVGTNVSLAITYTSQNAPPQVSWWKDGVSIAHWTVGIGEPQIASRYKAVLSLEEDGSLTFSNLTLDYTGTYEVIVVQVMSEERRALFNLTVYDIIEKVSLHTWPNDAVEGNGTFTLYYITAKGEAEEVQWFFNGTELQHGSHYSVSGKNLSIIHPRRTDTGLYSVTLKNPFSFGTYSRNVTVLYGPDQPMLDVSPTKDFFVLGESLWFSCGAQGEPVPAVSWAFMGQAVPSAQPGALHIANAQTSQSGVYTCMLINTQTGAQLNKSVTVNIYKSPAGSPVCSVHAVDESAALQYHCQWPGGTPGAQLSFPTLNTSSAGIGELNMTVDNPQGLDGTEVACVVHHPVYQGQCNITARKTAGLLPSVSAAVNENGKLLVTIGCVTEAIPNATVTWSMSGEDVSSLSDHEVSMDTTWLHIGNFNIITAGLHTYKCTAANPLGRQSSDIIPTGPAISEASLSSNEEGTVIMLFWEVPSMAIVTGFDIQMKGPDLSDPSTNITVSQSERAKEYQTLQVRPASSRSAEISGLDPKARYHFRVIPMAGQSAGEPSEPLSTGPGGLSGPAIAGIAAGIPCSLLVLLVVCVVLPCVLYHKKRNSEARYPVSRAVEKAVTTLSSPHHLLTSGLKLPPDYRLHQPPVAGHSRPMPSEPPPVRMATTV